MILGCLGFADGIDGNGNGDGRGVLMPCACSTPVTTNEERDEATTDGDDIALPDGQPASGQHQHDHQRIFRVWPYRLWD